ncbi:MAG: DNA-binding response regulator [Marinilabiliales bacterium]|nr:MAG: DNA-binding response regulator [Marinilabiliales bacterium]
MIRTLIVDDEANARETIADMLQMFCPNVEIVGQADSVGSAFTEIQKSKPELVLLDINMPDGTGFSLLKKFSPVPFEVIFITAYEEHAIKAFKINALDYILKPIDSDELVNAINKAAISIEKDENRETINKLLDSLNHYNKGEKQIVLKTAESIHIVNVQDIIRLESDRNYTRFFFADGKKLLVSTTLKEYDTLLSDFGFFRPHHSHLVNIKFLNRYEKADGGYIVLKDNSTVPVSSRKKDILFKLFDSL